MLEKPSPVVISNPFSVQRNEAKFQAEKIRLLGLDTLIQNASKPWIFEDSVKETIIFGKQLLDLLSGPPLDTTNCYHPPINTSGLGTGRYD
jgi:hypothetical protein